jgi:multisubunit Na+/H+ antiporter MnhB subunit
MTGLREQTVCQLLPGVCLKRVGDRRRQETTRFAYYALVARYQILTFGNASPFPSPALIIGHGKHLFNKGFIYQRCVSSAK